MSQGTVGSVCDRFFKFTILSKCKKLKMREISKFLFFRSSLKLVTYDDPSSAFRD